MSHPSLSVHEMTRPEIEGLVRYWVDSSDTHMLGMGVDLAKRPTAEQIRHYAVSQLPLPNAERTAYFLTWLADGQPIGHSYVKRIRYGEEASMHLHLWESPTRRRGLGTAFVRLSLPWYFEQLKLKRLLCEPYALNPAPNRTLPSVGFQLEKRYRTIPGPACFEQEVNQWMMTRAQYDALQPLPK